MRTDPWLHSGRYARTWVLAMHVYGCMHVPVAHRTSGPIPIQGQPLPSLLLLAGPAPWEHLFLTIQSDPIFPRAVMTKCHIVKRGHGDSSIWSTGAPLSQDKSYLPLLEPSRSWGPILGSYPLSCAFEVTWLLSLISSCLLCKNSDIM